MRLATSPLREGRFRTLLGGREILMAPLRFLRTNSRGQVSAPIDITIAHFEGALLTTCVCFRFVRAIKSPSFILSSLQPQRVADQGLACIPSICAPSPIHAADRCAPCLDASVREAVRSFVSEITQCMSHLVMENTGSDASDSMLCSCFWAGPGL